MKKLILIVILSIFAIPVLAADAGEIRKLELRLLYAPDVGWEDIIVAADELIKYKPHDPNVYYKKAKALAQLGKYKEAITNFDLAIKYKYKYISWLYYEKGNSLKNLNMLEEALESYNLSIKHGGENRWRDYAIDCVLHKLGRLGKSR